ncbi:MAG: hypothetical protein U0237_05840 [Thermoleophilia bacterium]
MAAEPIELGEIVADDRDAHYAIHVVTASPDRYCGRHAIAIPVGAGPGAYLHSFDLSRRESQLIGTDEGRDYFRRLAAQVRREPDRYRHRPVRRRGYQDP